jgi:hypothetical protein
MDAVADPLSWSERADGVPNLPGPIREWPMTLAALLEILAADGVSVNAIIDDPKGGEPIRAGEAARRLTRIGLIRRDGSRIVTTPDGRRWLETRDPVLLVGILHRHVRFMGELLDALQCGSRSHDQLLDVARARYGFRWDSDSPLRARTNWLRMAGMVDVYSGRVHLLDDGRAMLDRLVLGGPDLDPVEQTPELAPASGAIADLLHGLDEQRMRSRNRGSTIYIPGSQGGDGRLEAIRVLVECAAPGIAIRDLTRFCCETFQLKESSARSVLDSLAGMGLIQRTSFEKVAATPAAIQWLATDETDDLARIIHANLFYFGELLHDLDSEESQGTARGLAQCSNSYDAESGAMGKNSVVGRLQLLVAVGMVAKKSQSVWSVTPRGRMFRDSVNCMMRRNLAPLSRRDYAETSGCDPVSDGQGIAAELIAAGLDSAKPERLELAAVAAFNYLGLPSRHLGASGWPDGEIRTAAGKLGEALAMETKSAKNGSVQEEFGGLLGLAEQRAKIDAPTTVYIGPGFEPRLLVAADVDPQVAVVLTDLLADLVTRQDRNPLSPGQLAPLLNPALTAEERTRHFEALWEATDRAARIERTVADILCQEAEALLEDEGWMSVKLIRRELRSRELAVSAEEIQQALEFLTSPRISAIERSKPHGLEMLQHSWVYRATMTIDTVRRRIAAPARQWGTCT